MLGNGNSGDFCLIDRGENCVVYQEDFMTKGTSRE